MIMPNNTADKISLIALGLNILLFIINIVFTCVTRKKDFKRNVDFDFYELTLLKSLKDFFLLVAEINKIHTILQNEYTKTNDTEKCRKITDEAISKLDIIYEKNENELSPYLQGFNIDAYNKVHKLIEKYYDNITNVFSHYSEPELNSKRQSLLDKQYIDSNQETIRYIFDTIKTFCPK